MLFQCYKQAVSKCNINTQSHETETDRYETVGSFEKPFSHPGQCIPKKREVQDKESVLGLPHNSKKQR